MLCNRPKNSVKPRTNDQNQLANSASNTASGGIPLPNQFHNVRFYVELPTGGGNASLQNALSLRAGGVMMKACPLKLRFCRGPATTVAF